MPEALRRAHAKQVRGFATQGNRSALDAVALERAGDVDRARRGAARRAAARIAVGLVARRRALRLLAASDDGLTRDMRLTARAPEELHAHRPRSALTTWVTFEQAAGHPDGDSERE